MGPEAIEHKDALMRECSSIILIHLLPLELITEVSLLPRWAFNRICDKGQQKRSITPFTSS